MLPQIRIDRGAGVPLHQQLGNELRRLILGGALRPGTRLPSTRQAARELGISRNLVVMAYEQLVLEGYLRSAVGVGTWVPDSLGPHLVAPGTATRTAGAQGGCEQPALSEWGRQLGEARWRQEARRPALPFRPATTAAEHFPVRTWVRLTARHWRRAPLEMVHYGDAQGYLPLREALADHLGRHRAVSVSPERIVVTGGSQASLDLIARLLLDPGDRAIVEEPGYGGAIAAFRAAGAQLVPAPVDAEGANLAAIDAADGARLLYTTPSHQYPLGVTLTLERRLAMLEWAARNRSWIIEDDYDSEFRYASRPLPSLQGLGGADRVIYVGTFSKVLAAALRIGFIVLPGELVEPFVRARQVTDPHPPTSIQAPLADLIAGGHLERHIARMRGIYAERREALLGALAEMGGERIRPVSGDGGLHLAVHLTCGVDDVAVARLALRRGIDPQPLSAHYFAATPRSGLVLGYGGFAPARLVAAVGTLTHCIADIASGVEPDGDA